MNSFAMQRQLVLIDSQLEGFRRMNVYPQLMLRTLTQVACVNKQFSKEIGEMCLKPNCDKLTEAIVNAWHCFHEDGCYPQIQICTWDRFCYSNKKMQDKQGIDCIESIIKPGIWRENKCLIGKDNAAFSLAYSNNRIVFKSTDCDSRDICIDNKDTKKKGIENRIMTIYSIDRDVELKEDEFDSMVDNDISIPLVILLDSLVIKDSANMEFLLKRFEKLAMEKNNVIDTCLDDLKLLQELYSMTKNLEIDAIIAKWQNPQDYALRTENRLKFEKNDKKDQAQIKKDKKIKKLQQMTMRMELQRIDEEQAKLAKKNNEEK